MGSCKSKPLVDEYNYNTVTYVYVINHTLFTAYVEKIEQTNLRHGQYFDYTRNRLAKICNVVNLQITTDYTDIEILISSACHKWGIKRFMKY